MFRSVDLGSLTSLSVDTGEVPGAPVSVEESELYFTAAVFEEASCRGRGGLGTGLK